MANFPSNPAEGLDSLGEDEINGLLEIERADPVNDDGDDPDFIQDGRRYRIKKNHSRDRRAHLTFSAAPLGCRALLFCIS